MNQPLLPKPRPSAFSGRSLLLWLGLGFMFLGVYLTAVFYLFFIISLFLYVIGVVLVLASGPGQPAWLKVLAVLFPYLAAIGAVMVHQRLADRQPAATFLIPEGFEGPMLLVLGEPCGLPPEKVDGRLIYHVPANGVVITQNPAWNANAPENQYPNKGYYSMPDNEYYLVDRTGKRLRELTELAENYSDDPDAAPQTTRAWKSVSRDDVGVFPQSPSPSPLDDSTRYTYQEFDVSSFARLSHQANNDRGSTRRDLADRLVAQCRLRGGRPPVRVPADTTKL